MGEDDDSLEDIAVTVVREASWGMHASDETETSFAVPASPPDDLSHTALEELNLWQWQWDIEDGSERRYIAKARQHFVLSPSGLQETSARPCCYPGQELGVWYPFNCQSADGLLPRADKAAHCSVGPPASAEDEVSQWLETMGVSEAEYNGTMPS